MPKNKLAVIAETYPAPSETFIYRDLEELRNKGVDITLFYLTRGTGEDYLKRDTFKLPSLFNIIKYLPYLIFVWKVRKSFFPLLWKTFLHSRSMWADMYHFFSSVNLARLLHPYHERLHIHAEFASLPARYARTASSLLNTAYSISAHARDVLVETDDVSLNLYGAEFIIFCTKAVMNETCSRYEDLSLKSECIYHGLSIPEADKKQFNRDKLAVAAAGRFVEKKGFEYLIRACRIMKDNNADITCTIAGDGPLLKTYKELTAELGIDDIIDFPGFLSMEEITALWNRSDLICIPSVRAHDGDMDGIPNVVIEAGAQKVPAVTSDLPGLREAVQDGYNGFTAKAGSEEELAQSLQRFLDLTPGEKTDMGEHAREKVTDMFDISNNIQQWLDTFSRRGIEI